MREIKFRAKRRADGVWVYGTPVDGTNDKCYMVHGATEDAVNSKNEVDFYFSEVDPDTIGQFTGMNDINNNPVYEGDLVGVMIAYTPAIFQVLYVGGAFCLADEDGLVWHRLDDMKCEVVGNIKEETK